MEIQYPLFFCVNQALKHTFIGCYQSNSARISAKCDFSLCVMKAMKGKQTIAFLIILGLRLGVEVLLSLKYLCVYCNCGLRIWHADLSV